MDEGTTNGPARLCSMEGCAEPYYARGRCARHYRLWLRSDEGRATVRPKRSPTSLRIPGSETDRAYLAGLIDGDGSITRFVPSRGYWNIKVYMTDEEVIQWLTNNVGGTTSSYLAKDRTRRSYHWHLSRQGHVRTFLLAIAPHFRVHDSQARAHAAINEIGAKLGEAAVSLSYDWQWRGSRVRASTGRYRTAPVLDLPDDETVRAYLGGLVDSDGSVTRTDRKTEYWRVKVDMTETEIMDWLVSIGGTLASYLHADRTRAMNQWSLSRQAHVRTFLLAVSPYLKVHEKQRKAQAAIDAIDAKS